MLVGASAYLITAGPVTAQELWEENAGYSSSTLATIIAALCAAAELARAYGHVERSDFTLAYADWLNSHVEDWCVTTVGQHRPGKPRHYVRITPADPLAPTRTLTEYTGSFPGRQRRAASGARDRRR